jgi:dTDP-4-dehydrorhamnose 3,5-epimerase
MEFIERKLKGVYEIILEPHTDERGFFMRTYDTDIFKRSGLDFRWVQENHSRSEQKGIIRGLHFQLPPASETKLVRCITGQIFDVFIDLRADSPTFGLWDSIELSAENKKMILIPRGFAHGFLTLTPISEVLYKVDNYYSKELERGIQWNDKKIGIIWPEKDPVLSVKDNRNMSFDDFIKTYKGINA